MRLKATELSIWKIITAILFALGLYATLVRFGKGLGAATNLTDAFPWGIWIGFDVLVGVGLAAGGFVIAATVHIFDLKKYESISRPVILTAFLGYLLVIIAILFDLGRPYRIWHPLVMWNPHSVMFEVGWCVMLYTTVLALEFSPVVFEKFNMKVSLRVVRSIYIPIVIAGVLLSTLHQSSLGTLYVIVPDKLYGLWYSPFLPIFFFISAIAGGLAMTIFESFLSYRAFGKRLEKDILTGIARVIVVVLAVYLVFKFQDLSRRGNLGLAFLFNRESVLFWGEMGLGVILPMVLLMLSRVRERDSGLFFSALLVILGFIIGRLNVSITGMLNSSTYVPKWSELAITAAIVALGFTIFAYAVKYFPVYPQEKEEYPSQPAPMNRSDKNPVFSGKIALALWAFLLLGMIAIGLTRPGNNVAVAEQEEVESRSADPFGQELVLPENFVFPAGEDSPGPVTFSHENHMAFQELPNCNTCHSGSFRIIKADQSSRERLFMEPMYEGKSCGLCHNGKDAFDVQEDCETCHISEQ